MKITLSQAEALVDSRSDLHWDGWTIVQDIPNDAGWLRVDGIFNRLTRRWAVAKRFEMDDEGEFTIPKALGHGI